MRHGYVYEIDCAATGKVYVGSSVDTRRRWDKHKAALRRGVHVNPELQRDWDTYGPGAFTLRVVAETPTLADAREAEAARITDERPKYNTTAQTARSTDTPNVYRLVFPYAVGGMLSGVDSLASQRKLRESLPVKLTAPCCGARLRLVLDRDGAAMRIERDA